MKSAINTRKLPIKGFNVWRCGLHRTAIHLDRNNTWPVEIVLDFRGSDIERSGLVNILSKQRINFEWIPIQEKHSNYRALETTSYQDLFGFYKDLLLNNKHEYRYITNTVLKGMPIAYGCYAGKDRTGLLSYLVMSLLEIPFEVILKDYAQSEKHIRNEIDVFETNWLKRNISREEYKNRIISPPETLIALDKWIQAEFGNVKGYLRSD